MSMRSTHHQNQAEAEARQRHADFRGPRFEDPYEAVAAVAQLAMGVVSHPIRFARPLAPEVLLSGETQLERVVRRAREREAMGVAA